MSELPDQDTTKSEEEKELLSLNVTEIIEAIDEGSKKKALLDLLNNCDVDDINLNNCGLSQLELKVVCHCLLSNTNCKSISMGKSRLGDTEAAYIGCALKANRSVTYLNISRNDIGEAGARHLADGLKYNSTMIELMMNKNNIGGPGAASICDALKHNESVTDLNLNSNNIGDLGAKAIGELLKANSTLQYIKIRADNISNEGVIAISAGLENNKTLNNLALGSNKIGINGMINIANAVKIRGWLQLEVRGQRSTDKPKEISKKHAITDINLIGKGNFGSAFSATYGEHNCVAKVAHEEKSPESLYETLLLSYLPDHENVLKLFCISQRFEYEPGKQRQAVVVELHKGGSLQSYVKKLKGKLPLRELLTKALGMVRGIGHLHKYNMIHRDVATRNFVLSDDFQKVVLIDFGLSAVTKAGYVLTRQGEPLPYKWLPPECFISPFRFYKAADIWMMGVAYWEMLYIDLGKPFMLIRGFKPLMELFGTEMIQKKRQVPLKFQHPTFRIFKELIQTCCQLNREERPSAVQLAQKIESLLENLTEDEEAKLDTSESDDDDAGDLSQYLDVSSADHSDDYVDYDTEDYDDYEDFDAYKEVYDEEDTTTQSTADYDTHEDLL